MQVLPYELGANTNIFSGSKSLVENLQQAVVLC